jgi:DnaJ-class molecular chaperone
MKEVCDTCGGSGQISYFKGVSRFLLSCEECPDCAGLGYRTSEDRAGLKKYTKATPAKKKKHRGK